MSEIHICETDESINAVFPVISQLRPHLKREDFVSTIRRMEKTQNYKLVALTSSGEVCAAMGLRRGESLAWGRYVYIDDLVTDAGKRSAGWGKQLLGWAADYGKSNGCAELHLDSGVQRHQAHRFYLRERMDIVFYHFKKAL